MTAKRRDGTPIVTYSSAVLRGQSVAGVRGIVVDVSERKKAERALRESEERFRLIFDQLPLGAAIVSLDYRFVRVNDVLCRMTGYSSEELTQRHFPDITHPDDRADDLARAQRLIAGEIDCYDIEKRYVRKDGRIVWVHVFARVTRDSLGRPLNLLPIIEDITARRQMEAALRESQARQMEAEKLATTGRMAAGVAHEINNPLAGIRNAFRLVKDAVPPDHPDRDMVERIDKEISHISNVVRQFGNVKEATIFNG